MPVWPVDTGGGATGTFKAIHNPFTYSGTTGDFSQFNWSSFGYHTADEASGLGPGAAVTLAAGLWILTLELQVGVRNSAGAATKPTSGALQLLLNSDKEGDQPLSIYQPDHLPSGRVSSNQTGHFWVPEGSTKTVRARFTNSLLDATSSAMSLRILGGWFSGTQVGPPTTVTPTGSGW